MYHRLCLMMFMLLSMLLTDVTAQEICRKDKGHKSQDADFVHYFRPFRN